MHNDKNGIENSFVHSVNDAIHESHGICFKMDYTFLFLKRLRNLGSTPVEVR